MINTRDLIETCVNHIENNINNKITLEDIAQNVGISKFHLHRIFKSITGESIIEYAQERKLASSINELINTNMRIIDIALEYGFDYEQSYIRAFKKKLGYTPHKVRSEQVSIPIKEKINMNDIVSLNNSITYKPFYVFKQKFHIIGSKYKIQSRSGVNVANIYGKEFYYNHRDKITNSVNPHVYFGYTNWSSYNDGHIYYIPSIQVSSLSSVPEGMIGITIPAHKYVVFRFAGFFCPDDINGRQVGRLLVHLYRKWIIHSGFKLEDKFRFEYIDLDLCDDNYCELDIYQPIK